MLRINDFPAALFVAKEKIYYHCQLSLIHTGTIHFAAQNSTTFNSLGNSLCFYSQSMHFISPPLANIDEARQSPCYLL